MKRSTPIRSHATATLIGLGAICAIGTIGALNASSGLSAAHAADPHYMIVGNDEKGEGGEPGQLELTEVEMKAACDEARLRGGYCVIHAHGADGHPQRDDRPA